MNDPRRERTLIDPSEKNAGENYYFLISAVVPRPIAWVSSLAADGTRNLAPFSFFQGVCADPPTLMISIHRSKSSGGPKDTLANIEARGEFVVNLVGEELAQPMLISSREYGAEVDEIERAGLATFPAERVEPPCILESPVNLECRVSKMIDLGSCRVVFGEILLAHVRPDLLDGRGNIDPEKLRPLSRMGGSDYLPYSRALRLKPPPE